MTEAEIETIKKEFEERFITEENVLNIMEIATLERIWNFFETKLNEIREEAVRGFASELMRKDGWLNGLEMDIVGLRDRIDNEEEITNMYEQLEFLRVQVVRVKYFIEEYVETYLTTKEME